jgi:hypothetical protein
MPVSEAAIATASTRCERTGSGPAEVMSVGIGASGGMNLDGWRPLIGYATICPLTVGPAP